MDQLLATGDDGVDHQSLSGQREAGQYSAANALISRYVYGPDLDEHIVTIAASGAKTWLHPDAQGTVIADSGPTGAVGNKYAYGPFGETPVLTGGNYRYTGRVLDAATGLYYYRARMYSPVLGRFMQTDPSGYKGGNNLYAYVGNDPLNNTDPTGLWGFGLIGSGSVEGGIFVGAGATGSAGGGVFGGGTQGVNVGGFVSGGAFVGVGDLGASYPAPLPGGTTGAVGGYAGVGAGGFISNATSADELSGPFNTYSINTPLGSFQFGKSGDTWIASLTCGVPPCGIGYGYGSASTYPTNTWATPDVSSPTNHSSTGSLK